MTLGFLHELDGAPMLSRLPGHQQFCPARRLTLFPKHQVLPDPTPAFAPQQRLADPACGSTTPDGALVHQQPCVPSRLSTRILARH